MPSDAKAKRNAEKIEVENVWVECAQLDLEAKGLVLRDRTAKPLRWRRGPQGA